MQVTQQRTAQPREVTAAEQVPLARRRPLAQQPQGKPAQQVPQSQKAAVTCRMQAADLCETCCTFTYVVIKQTAGRRQTGCESRPQHGGLGHAYVVSGQIDQRHAHTVLSSTPICLDAARGTFNMRCIAGLHDRAFTHKHDFDCVASPKIVGTACIGKVKRKQHRRQNGCRSTELTVYAHAVSAPDAPSKHAPQHAAQPSDEVKPCA